MSADPVTVHVDGLIYGLQTHGGISRVFTNLLRALAKRDDVSVALYLPEGAWGVPPLLKGVRTCRAPRVPVLKPRRVFGRVNSSLAALSLRRMWAKAKDGVFLSSHYSSPDGLRIPQVVVIQDMIYERLPEIFASNRDRRHVEEKRRCAERAAAVICPSAWSIKDASELYDLGGKVTAVIPYAVDDTFRTPVSVAEVESFKKSHACGEDFILHTGSRYLHKNFGALLAGFSRWQGRDRYRLLSVGGGECTADEAALTRGLGLMDRVRVIPRLADDDLAIAYHAATAFVFPSLYEGFGFPLAEALACGVPCATSNASCLAEVGGEAPWYFDPTQESALLTALDKVISEDRSSSRVLQAKTRAMRRTWNDVADDYVRVFRSTEARRAARCV